MDPHGEFLLACPVCEADLTTSPSGARCVRGHAFDRARQGYLGLLQPGALTSTGDDLDMVRARLAFLGAGHYAALLAALVDRVATTALPEGGVLELGAGTAYYIGGILDALPGRPGLALDTSKPALRVAARAHPRLTAAAADVWGRLPVRDAAIAVALTVFAPRNPVELARVLGDDGLLLTVTPGPEHLRELRDGQGAIEIESHKQQRLSDSLGGAGLRCEAISQLDLTLALHHAAVDDLLGMGPAARHESRTQRTHRVARLPEPYPVRASFRIGRWRRVPRP